jgi:hypothetical protein
MLKNSKIWQISNTDDNFYELMGRVFGSRFIEKQVGLKIYDDSNKQWVITTINDDVIGFCSLQASTISDCFVYPNYRLQGVFNTMLDLLLSKPGNYRAVCTKMSLQAFLNRGFQVTKTTKNFTFVERTANA